MYIKIQIEIDEFIETNSEEEKNATWKIKQKLDREIVTFVRFIETQSAWKDKKKHTHTHYRH